MKKRRLVLLFALMLAAAPGAFARGEDQGCECERRCEGRPDRPPRHRDREIVERLRRLRELRRTREGLERVLRPFDVDGDGRLDEAERRRIRTIRELRERRRERLWELRERRWERMREARERMRGLRELQERRGERSVEAGPGEGGKCRAGPEMRRLRRGVVMEAG